MKPTAPLAALPGLSPLLESYASCFQRVAEWYHYDPHEPEVITRRLADLSTRAPLAPDAVSALVAQQQAWEAGEASSRAAAELGRPQTCVVVTGQQAGLFTGPLYTVLKAASAVKLARRLAVQHPGHRFVPVFWMAANDSDYDEVRRTWVLDPSGTPRELALPPVPESEGLMVALRDVRPALDELLGGLEDHLPAGPYQRDTLELVREAYRDGNLVEGFARLLARLFDGSGLVIVNPQEPALLRATVPLITSALEQAADHELAVRDRNSAILAAGFKLQVAVNGGDTGLFLLDDRGVRQRIARAAGGGFVLRRTGQRLATAELLALAHDTPERFVPDVSLRSVFEDAMFPVAAFIGGAAEIAYRAQFTPLFGRNGRRMAPTYLRATATLLPSQSATLLDELGWELTDCFRPLPEVEDTLAARGRSDAVETALAGYRETVGRADLDLEQAAVALDPNLGQVFGTLRSNLDRHIDKLEKKITSALKRRDEVLLGRVRRLHALVYSRRMPQERLLSCLSFLPRYGPGLIEMLLDTLDVPSWEHQILILE